MTLVLLSSQASPVHAAFAEPDGSYDVVVVEHLRLKVPAEGRQAWLEAERGSWEPWLAQQEGFLDRQLLWDPVTEEGTLLIRWVDREHWKAIAPQAVQRVLSEVANDVLLIALKGASPAVSEFMLSNVTKAKADRLRFEMDGLPPVRVQEVESKQREVVQVARRLQDEKVISLDRMGAGASAGVV